MTRRTLYTALLALFVAGSAAVPLQAQTPEEGVPAAQNEPAPEQSGELVTVQVSNNSWSDMRIYVVETATQQTRWRLGNVTALSRARFELPDHLEAELSHLVLVAVAIGSRQRQFTDRLQTWPGALVDWRINAQLGLSFATVY